MTRIALIIALVRIFFHTSAVGRSPEVDGTRLGENCHNDIDCQKDDINSECSLPTDQNYGLIYICSCKLGYRVEIINNTEKCVIGELLEEEKEGLTAAPIILCFMACVVVEAFCLLAFRYWKKNRRYRVTRNRALRLQAFPLASTPIPRAPRNRPIVSLLITTRVDTSASGAGANSPPPYSQTEISLPPPYSQKVIEESTAEGEEPPPTYEEAMKQLAKYFPIPLPPPPPQPEEQSQDHMNRKLSC